MKVQQLFDVQGDVTFITGGARGMGQAFAEVMAANGARIALYDIDGPALEEAAAELRATGAEVITTQGDVADSPALRAAVDATVAHWGKLDSVFANAGMSAGRGYALSEAGRLEAVDLATWERVLQVNLTSVMVTMQAATPHMKAQRSGRMIVNSSVGGLRVEPQVGYGYSATKSAIAHIVRHAALELAPWNILVNCVAPGAFRTNLGSGRLNDPAVAKIFEDMSPLKRIASLEEFKGLMLLLASPASSFMTGTVIPIDGGAMVI